MMLSSDFTTYFLFYIVVILIFYTIGFSLQKLLQIKVSGSFRLIFFRLLAGCIALLTIGAIVYSKGMTVMVGLLILSIYSYVLYHKKKNEIIIPNDNKPQFSWKEISILAGGTFTLFVIQYLSWFQMDGAPVVADLDTLFYSNVSNYLTLFGKESLSLDFLKMSEHGCEPYHFGDIWINTMVKDLFHLNSCLSFKLITYPVIILMVFVGYCALAEQVGFKGGVTCLFSFLFLSFSGLYFSFFENIKYLSESNIFSFNPLSYPKLGFVYLLLQASLLVYFNGYRLNALAIFAALPVFFMTLLPAISLTMFLIALRSFITKKKYLQSIKEVAPIALVGVFVLLFYHFQPAAVSVNSSQLGSTLASLTSFRYCKTFINIIALSSIQNAIVFLPLILIVTISFSLDEIRSNLFKNELIFITATFFFIALVSWAVFHDLTETVQLFTNVSDPLLQVFAFAIVLGSWNKITQNRKYIVSLILIITLSCNGYYSLKVLNKENVYSADYLRATAALVKVNYSEGAFMLAPADYDNYFARASVYCIRGFHLSCLFNNYYSYSLSVFEMPINENYAESEKQHLVNSIFYKYVAKQKLKGSFQSVNQSRLDFMHEYKINHIFISKGATIDSLLQSRILKTIVDSKTGEQFCLIKH
ncbi:MAG: hypothetical protein ABI723_13805 [Bacteroidia bacterium]